MRGGDGRLKGTIYHRAIAGLLTSFVGVSVGAAAFSVGAKIVVKPEASSLEAMQAAFLIVVGLSALDFTMASALDANERPVLRQMLIECGNLEAVGSLLFFAAMTNSYMLGPSDRPPPSRHSTLLGVFVGVPYVFGAIFAIRGIIISTFIKTLWIFETDDS